MIKIPSTIFLKRSNFINSTRAIKTTRTASTSTSILLLPFFPKPANLSPCTRAHLLTPIPRNLVFDELAFTMHPVEPGLTIPTQYRIRPPNPREFTIHPSPFLLHLHKTTPEPIKTSTEHFNQDLPRIFKKSTPDSISKMVPLDRRGWRKETRGGSPIALQRGGVSNSVAISTSTPEISAFRNFLDEINESSPLKECPLCSGLKSLLRLYGRINVGRVMPQL